MLTDQSDFGMIPVFNADAGVFICYPLRNSTLRSMSNPLGSIYGRFRNQGSKFHAGWDLHASVGEPVLTIDSGTVEAAWSMPNGDHSYGKQVVVKLDHLAADNRPLFYHVAHLSSWIVQAGQRVDAGQQIGNTGVTGNADIKAPHLHFEIRRSLDGKAGRIDPGLVFPDLLRSYLHARRSSGSVLRRAN